MTRPKIAVLDDDQGVARHCADWSGLEARADVTFLTGPIPPARAAEVLAPFEVLVPMRERTAFPATLIGALPALRMIAMTGARAQTLDLAACTARGIVVSNTGGTATTAGTAELAWMLLQACARRLPQADAGLRAGLWQDAPGVYGSLGEVLDGKRLGIVGLGRLGSRMARYAAAFGMEVVAWSQNLTEDAAQAAGARLVDKAELFATADAVSLHLVLSARTENIVGAAELGAMKPGAILVNTSRGPLVDRDALLAALGERRIVAGLDVFHTEPLPVDDPLRGMANAVLTPHLGYSVWPGFRQFYGQAIENVTAFLDGAPIRVVS